ncbi:hypothetical protein LF1_53680 [Rubripirellula obstinata]|uniref:Uncharacterized protein n=1 Tax=Rubripirellula obstinata TaxID=406547 RepID=A0A5B1CC33_9BACT|nr:hypothetical protein [Rubripirellula obstinata]KAA1257219.1 hypothetical protein LF1_53680 [Rubripirellula obstinata]
MQYLKANLCWVRKHGERESERTDEKQQSGNGETQAFVLRFKFASW